MVNKSSMLNMRGVYTGAQAVELDKQRVREREMSLRAALILLKTCTLATQAVMEIDRCSSVLLMAGGGE